MKFDVGTEVPINLKDYLDRFLNCYHEPYMIISFLESFIFFRFSLIYLLMPVSVFSITLPASIFEVIDPL